MTYIIWPRTITVAQCQFRTRRDYCVAYHEALLHYGHNKAKVDDGQGGRGWKFFESAEELRIWRNQK